MNQLKFCSGVCSVQSELNTIYRSPCRRSLCLQNQGELKEGRTTADTHAATLVLKHTNPCAIKYCSVRQMIRLKSALACLDHWVGLTLLLYINRFDSLGLIPPSNIIALVRVVFSEWDFWAASNSVSLQSNVHIFALYFSKQKHKR